jgi:hypothetical protein
MLLRASIKILLVIAICATALGSEARAATLNLMDFGAVGDGTTDDGPALQSALNALAAAGGGTLIVPEGRYAIITPVSKNFAGLATSITILGVESTTPVDTTGPGNELSEGLDLLSEFLPRTGPSNNAVSIFGLQTFLVKDIAWVGTPNVATDARVTLLFDNVEDATIRHCEFYGLSSQVAGGSIVASFRGGLRIDQTKFLGSTGNSGVYVPAVENLEWKSIIVTDTVFLDYGLRPELFSKTGLAAAFSWVNIGNAKPVTNTSPRREASFQRVFLDEGGLIGLTSLPRRYLPASAPIDLIYVSALRMNVSNLEATGHQFDGTQSVFIENSRYVWSRNADSAISLIGIARHAIIDGAECLDNANRIRADAATTRLSVINSTYTYLDSLAQTTNVINTATPEEDPVQYVRQQFVSVLGRAPDPAAHYYWSDLLLMCGANSQCLTTVRQNFAYYLNSLPSPTFSIQGLVNDENGSPLSGVAIALGGSQTVTTQTDALGRYSFSNLPTSGNYTLNASKRHYTFGSMPSVNTPSGDRIVNASGTLNRHTLRGRVNTTMGKAVANATITLSGAQSGTTTTDSNGNWSFANLRAGLTYTLRASKSTFVFTPQSFTTQDLSEDRTFDFTLVTYSITGDVLRANGTPVSGVTVTRSGSESAVDTTDINGHYGFSDVAAGGNYVITPTRPHTTFSPTSRSITGLSSNQTGNFTATNVNYTVSGKITLNGAGFGGVTVNLLGSDAKTATTDSSGNYSFSVLAEGAYTVTPVKKHYTFAPAPQTVSYLSSNRTMDFAATQNRHTIFGRVSTANSVGISGVTLTLSGSSTGTTTTNQSGDFSFNLPAGGNYTVTPSRQFFSFNPASRTYSDLEADQYAAFGIQQNLHTISGRVTKADGTGLAEVNVSLSGPQGGSRLTDANGNYSFVNLPAGNDYFLTLSKPSYRFTPPNLTINKIDANHTANFGAVQRFYTISGRITGDNLAIAAVSVNLTGTQTGSTSTNANGDFSFTVLADGSYTVTPSRQFFSFSPASRTYSNVDSDQVAAFGIQQHLHTISGRVTKADGTGLAEVNVTLSGPQGGSRLTDANGNYSFANLPAGNDYFLTLSKPSYRFNPPNLTINKIDANHTANFGAVQGHYSITGRITVGNFAMPAVSVSLGGSQTGTTSTNSNGDFSFTVLADGSYTVTPNHSRYTFTPTTATANQVTQDVTRNFTASLKPGVPLLVSQPTSTRGLALDSVLLLGEPFELSYEYPWSADRRTRIVLYVTNLDLQPGETQTAVTVEAEDGSNRTYPLTVEFFGEVPEATWLNRVVVRLNDNLGNVGDVLVRLTYRGLPSNRVRIGIGHVGGGLPDDTGSFPTPGQPPN